MEWIYYWTLLGLWWICFWCHFFFNSFFFILVLSLFRWFSVGLGRYWTTHTKNIFKTNSYRIITVSVHRASFIIPVFLGWSKLKLKQKRIRYCIIHIKEISVGYKWFLGEYYYQIWPVVEHDLIYYLKIIFPKAYI